jgi:hypothetical protein
VEILGLKQEQKQQKANKRFGEKQLSTSKMRFATYQWKEGKSSESNEHVDELHDAGLKVG